MIGKLETESETRRKASSSSSSSSPSLSRPSLSRSLRRTGKQRVVFYRGRLGLPPSFHFTSRSLSDSRSEDQFQFPASSFVVRSGLLFNEIRCILPRRENCVLLLMDWPRRISHRRYSIQDGSDRVAQSSSVLF